MVLFTKERLDTEKPMLVGNILPLKFSGGPLNQVITVNIQVSWDPYISVSVVTALDILVDKALLCIVMNARREVIRLECDCE